MAFSFEKFIKDIEKRDKNYREEQAPKAYEQEISPQRKYNELYRERWYNSIVWGKHTNGKNKA